MEAIFFASKDIFEDNTASPFCFQHHFCFQQKAIIAFNISSPQETTDLFFSLIQHIAFVGNNGFLLHGELRCLRYKLLYCRQRGFGMWGGRSLALGVRKLCEAVASL